MYIYIGFGDFGLGLFFRIYGNWAPFATSTILNLGLSRGWAGTGAGAGGSVGVALQARRE